MMLNRMPAVGDTVQCPKDRGDKAYQARIVHVSNTVSTNIHGVKYVWCTVQTIPDGDCGGVWPSHRLGYKLPE